MPGARQYTCQTFNGERPMIIEEIAKKNWTVQDMATAVVPFVKEAIESGLGTQAAPWNTSTLVGAMYAEAKPWHVAFRNLTAHVGVARKLGLLDGYFALHPTKKMFGSPFILWGKV